MVTVTVKRSGKSIKELIQQVESDAESFVTELADFASSTLKYNAPRDQDGPPFVLADTIGKIHRHGRFFAGISSFSEMGDPKKQSERHTIQNFIKWWRTSPQYAEQKRLSEQARKVRHERTVAEREKRKAQARVENRARRKKSTLAKNKEREKESRELLYGRPGHKPESQRGMPYEDKTRRLRARAYQRERRAEERNAYVTGAGKITYAQAHVVTARLAEHARITHSKMTNIVDKLPAVEMHGTVKSVNKLVNRLERLSNIYHSRRDNISKIAIAHKFQSPAGIKNAIEIHRANLRKLQGQKSPTAVARRGEIYKWIDSLNRELEIYSDYNMGKIDEILRRYGKKK